MNQGVALERTRRKGWWPTVFFSAPVPAEAVRRILRGVLVKAGLPITIEIFPKQDWLPPPSSRDRTAPLGNFTHLPYFSGKATTTRPGGGRVVVDMTTLAPLPLDIFLASVKPFPVDAVPLVLDNLPREPASVTEHGNAPGWVLEALRSRPNVGERRPTLVKLTGWLKDRGIHEEAAVELLGAWAGQAFREPLAPEEVAAHVRGTFSRYSAAPSARPASLARYVREESAP